MEYTWLWVGSLTYLILVRLLRYRRLAQIQRLQAPDPATYGSMSLATAQHIVRSLGELEFPTLYEKALAFALFRTYGIPTISSTLVRSGLLSRPASASKRYADTAVIVSSISAIDWLSC